MALSGKVFLYRWKDGRSRLLVMYLHEDEINELHIPALSVCVMILLHELNVIYGNFLVHFI
jgi:hypothetical protein